MKVFNEKQLCASLIALTAMTVAHPVFAQTTMGESANPGEKPASLANDSEAGEIVVTANKREQNLSKVGLTITALSGDDLVKQRVSDVSDLAKITPGLAFAPTANSTPVYTLRGVGFFETTLSAYPDVSTYIDQAPLPLPVMSALTAFDLERVEILKGPQGTLFGNNATGGAINFIAAKPSADFTAGAEFGYGRFNTVEASVYISGPITDTLRARLAIKSVNGDDWQKSYTRIDGGVPAQYLAIGVPDNPNKEQDTIGKRDNIAARFLLDWEATDQLKFALNVNGWRDQNDPVTPQYQEPRLQYAVGAAGPGGVVPIDYHALIYPVAPNNARYADWSPNLRPFADNKFWQAALRTDYEIVDNHTLTSITSYASLRFLNATNGSGMAFEAQDIDQAYGRAKSFSQELRLSNGARNALRYTLGANYEHTTALEALDLYLNGITAHVVNGFNGTQYGSDQTMDNYAAFGNLEYDVTPTVTIKGGIRQTKAKRAALQRGTYEIPGFFAPGAFGPNSLTTFFNAAYGQIYGAGTVPTLAPGQSLTIDNRGFNIADPASSVPVDSSTFLKTGNPGGKLNEDSTSWSVGVNYTPIPELLLYLNASKGYKAGSFPTLSGAIYDAYAPVKQEALLDIEGGFKAQLFDRKLSINAAAFYYDYSNKQLRAKFVDPIFGALDKLLNVPKSTIKGAEIDINARPFEGLTLSGSATYLDAKVKRYEGVIGSHLENGLRIADTASFAGVPLPFAPKFQFALRVDYEFPLSDRINANFGVGVNGQSKSIGSLYLLPADQKAFKIPNYTLVDLTAGISSSDGRWHVGIWGKNVFNKYYWTNVIQAYDNLMRYPGRPAEYGMVVGFKY